MSGPFDLVVFDNDGVLVDSEPIANRILCEDLAALGLDFTLEESTEAFLGRTMTHVLAVVEERLGRPAPPDFPEKLRARTLDAFRADLKPVPGVADALSRIDLPVCVASSGIRRRVRTCLELTGLLDRFDGRIFAAEDVARGKPHPDLFLFAARTMGADPARTAVVEDSPAGVRAGLAAGMTVFGYAPREAGPLLESEGARVFSDMAELPGLL